MNTKQINKLFKNNLNYLGTFPKDLLQSSSKNKFGLIINTDNSDMPGEHWVAIFKNNNKVEYFDSFGLPPLHEEIIHYLNNVSKMGWAYNTVTFKNEKSDACGMYCVMFLKLKFKGYKSTQIASLFSHKTKLNDTVAKTLYNLL